MTFAVTPDNEILSRVVNAATSADPTDYHEFVSGKQIAEYTNNASLDPTRSITVTVTELSITVTVTELPYRERDSALNSTAALRLEQ